MASRRITVKGLDGLRSDLTGLSDDLVEAMREVREEIAEELAADIEADAPFLTGALKRSVDVDGDVVRVGGGRVEYAGIVESKDPFIRPAVEAMRARGVKIAGVAVKKTVRKRVG